MASSLIFPPPVTISSDEEPIRAPVRRTYGRQRPASPPTEPQVNLFQPTSPPTSHSCPSTSNGNGLPKTSPSKAYLDRWSANSTSWLGSLDTLGHDEPTAAVKTTEEVTTKWAGLTDYSISAKPQNGTKSSQTEEDEDDMEAVKREMERMRREARGEGSSSTQQKNASTSISAPTTVPAVSGNATLAVPQRRLGVAGTSSLTSLPTSSPRSSPPRQISRAVVHAQSTSGAEEEETMPIRMPGHSRASGKVRQVIMSEDEDEEEEAGASKPTNAHVRSPSASSSVSGRQGSKVGNSDVGDSGDESDTASAIPPLHDFLSELQAEDQAQNEAEKFQPPQHSGSPEDLVGLFDDDDEATRGASSKKIKPLNKRDMDLMRKDMARAEREREVVIMRRPKAAEMPISSWFSEAHRVLQPGKSKGLPDLVHGGGSPPSSPTHTTPAEEITSFTPSSGAQIRARLNGSHITTGSNRGDALHTSSPTPAGVQLKAKDSGTVIPATSEDAEEAAILDLDEVLRRDEEVAERQRQRQVQQERLRQFKLMQLEKQKQTALLRAAKQQEDDDFSILPDEKTPTKAGTTSTETTRRRGPDAKAVLAKGSSNSPAIDKRRQNFLRHAGKSTRQKASVTETYIDHGSKTWDHAGEKNKNGGAKPAGQKKGRDSIITMEQMNQMAQNSHRAQAAALRQKKEAEWGRVRSLPERREQDFEAMIAASSRARPTDDNRMVDDDEEEEGEDDDFVPDDDDEDGDEEDNGSQEEDVAMAFSGESEAEDDAHQDEVEVAADESETTSSVGDKENRPTSERPISDGEDEDENTLVRRKPKASARVIFDSDDENETTPKASKSSDRPPLAELEVPQSKSLDIPDIDLAGFDSGGSPGFSQLFEATQPADQPTAKDALADLRDGGNAGFLAANALLPGVDISETQIERDNALIAAELEAAQDESLPQEEPKKQYLNEKGYFTQTRPAMPSENTQARTANLLRRNSTFSLIDAPLSDEGIEMARTPSSTQLDTAPRVSGLSYSPTQITQPLNRLRRRAPSADLESGELQQATSSRSPSPSIARAPRNAFNHMMEASRRKEERKRLVDNNWIDEQAEESDEDNGWLPLGGGEGDDEEDGDDDGFVPDLVDDQVVADEEKRAQDELAAAKAREIAEEDDARREAEAKKITEGHYRTKRRGMDFYSDGEEGDEERGGKRRKWSKKERRKRRLDREDGLEKLEGEANAFLEIYNEDLESDEDSTVEDEPMNRERTKSPTPEVERRSTRETMKMLRERARINASRDAVDEDMELDKAIGFDGTGFNKSTGFIEVETDDEVVESQFSISRSVRTSTSFIETESYSSFSHRSKDTYAKYVQEESQVNRRLGGVAGVSVVVKKPVGTRIVGSRPSLATKSSSRSDIRPPSRADSTSSGGSILQSKKNRFS